MATDPVRQIRRRHLGHDFSLALDGVIANVAGLAPNTKTPYLTATVDWSPQGGNPGRIAGEALKASQRGRLDPDDASSPNRPARTELKRLGDDVLARYEPRTPAHDSIAADLERIADALENELDESAHGAVIVANHGEGVFKLTPLGLPVETKLSVGAVPAIRTLVRLAEDNEPYGVVITDQHESVLTFYVQHYPLDEVAITASGWPRKQSSGAMNQRRYQARADERVDAKAKVVADEVRTALETTGVQKLIVGGSNVMVSALDAAWHDEVKHTILDSIQVAPDATTHDIVEQVYPIVTAAEREDELAAVAEVEAAIGRQTLGRSGAEAVAPVLARGQVELLVINDDFSAEGWIDPNFALAGVGESPAEHPAGGDLNGIMKVELGDEFIRMALHQGARVEVVHTMPLEAPSLDGDGTAGRSDAAARLDALGGVGVVLRFSVMPNE
jgi:hypothetical protein